MLKKIIDKRSALFLSGSSAEKEVNDCLWIGA